MDCLGELPFLNRKYFKSLQNGRKKFEKASARNVLLGCIFLYIHICFYTSTVTHHMHTFLVHFALSNYIQNFTV